MTANESFAMEDAMIRDIDRKREAGDATVKEWREVAARLREHAEDYVPQVFDWLDAELEAGSVEGLLLYKSLTDSLESDGTIADCLSGLMTLADRHVFAPVLLDKSGAGAGAECG